MLEGWRPCRPRTEGLLLASSAPAAVAVRRAIPVLCSAVVPRSLVRPARRAASPAGHANTAPPKATALILGQVVDGTTGQPIAEAIVTLTGDGMRGRGANLGALGGRQLSPQQQQAMQAASAAAAAAPGADRADRSAS